MTLGSSQGTEKALTILKLKQKDLWSILMAAVKSTIQSIEAKCTCYYQPTARAGTSRVTNNLMGK